MLFIFRSLFIRYRTERASRQVEVCVSWDDTEDLLREDRLNPKSEPMSLATFFERCKIMGVSSVALKEDSLESLADDGKAIFFSSQEIEKLRSLGSAGSDVVNPNFLWIRKDSALSERVARALEDVKLKKVITKKLGDYTLIENPNNPFVKEQFLNVGFDPSQVKTLEILGLSYVHLINERDKNITEDPPSPLHSAWLFIPAEKTFRMKPAKKIAGSILNADVERIVQKSDTHFALFENLPEINPREIPVEIQRRTVRAHTISPEEMKNLLPDEMKFRWLRAVQERSCRFLYFRWNPSLTAEENLVFLREVLQDLKSRGFALQKITENESFTAPGFNVEKPWRTFRLALAFAVVSITPVFALLGIKKISSPSVSFLKRTFLTWISFLGCIIGAGLLIPAILPDTAFITGIDVFRGVKLSLFVPLALAGLFLYSRDEILGFMNRKISMRDLLLVLVAAFGLYKVLERSGNLSSNPYPVELAARSMMEQWLGARPRFKEFLIGHPAMILGIYLWASSGSGNRPANQAKCCLWIGTLGFVSVLNSFCHLHTPLSVTLLRTFHGAWIGALLGVLLVFLYRAFVESQNRSSAE